MHLHKEKDCLNLLEKENYISSVIDLCKMFIRTENSCFTNHRQRKEVNLEKARKRGSG